MTRFLRVALVLVLAYYRAIRDFLTPLFSTLSAAHENILSATK